MPSRSVVLIGYDDFPNLGMGYLKSVLTENGFMVEVLDIRLGDQVVLERIHQLDPLIVGMSIIFQYYTPEFARLAAFLKENGVTALICAGGHYPSLRHEALLESMPALDCVVRFEGEYTLLDLAECLYAGRDWHTVKSIAYRTADGAAATVLRPLIPDLDVLPFPHRTHYDQFCAGVPFTDLIASRGCPRACSFCSIRRFYAIPPGPLRRMRSPSNVIAEMRELYHDHGIRIFLFQDDDFSFMSRRDRRWIADFLACLRESELHDQIIWKINCRSDEVEPRAFAEMKDAGLFIVYLGIESGNETGLSILNKQITVEQNRQAVATLKAIGLRFEFGFMLFDPSSTFDLVLQNIAFLREICADGSTPVSFGKTLPYAGTDLESQLADAGRLVGDPCHPDYDFLDPNVNRWFAYLAHTLGPWVFGGYSLQAQIRWAQFETDALRCFQPDMPGLEQHCERIQFVASWYNTIFFRVFEESAPCFRRDDLDVETLKTIRYSAEQQRRWLEERLTDQRSTFLGDLAVPRPERAAQTAAAPVG